MEKSRTWRDVLFSDLGILILLALASILLRTLSNGQYGFHRDELATLDDARYLAWGYVAYPPLTPFIARVALELFGPSLVGVRLFAALALSIAMVLAGLMARELGGSRLALIVTALAVTIAPMSLSAGALFQYVSFDYLWWVLIAYLTIRLLKSEDPRWWLGIGAVAGLGMMTKYTIAFLIVGIVGGLVLTKARRYLVSPWLRESAPYVWGGVALSLLIFLPNLIWQVQHNFISLEFLSSIHARDVRIGRTEGYLIEQLIVCVNPLTIPLWVAGLYYYFFKPAGKRYRLLSWMYVIPFALFLVTQARSYYLAPAYPMLLAAGAVVWEQWLVSLSVRKARVALGTTWGALAVGGALFGALVLPIAPVNSGLWDVTSQMHDNFSEQIGWQDLVETVAAIYATLPAAEKPQAGILAGNYGEAGAINLYGPAYGLPEAISGINSYWLRGYGDPAPQTLIVVGFPSYTLERIFRTCDLAGHVTNRYGVKNEETRDHPDIFVCRGLRQPWPEFWKHFRYFG
jgi:4-amino-4-deoxy-L-arabinose transferase-like glycosyltransferase